MLKKVSITTVPFAKSNILYLEKMGFDVKLNSHNRKIKYDEIYKEVCDADIIIAGTEKYDIKLLSQLPNLKAISRVGSGIDSIDLKYAQEKKIEIFNTLEEPGIGVAEYCLGITICMLRDIFFSHEKLHNHKNWQRNIGLSLADAKIGLLGGGKVAARFKDHLIAAGASKIYVHDKLDLNTNDIWKSDFIHIAALEEISDCDLISIHLPLTEDTKNSIDDNFFSSLTKNPYLINTSRGEIIKEDSLIKALENGTLSGAAVDVYDEEPYKGRLLGIDNLITTPHIASSSRQVRDLMEKKSIENLINFYESI
jgi:D-3-phosphoglycerate dehydrogenase